MNNCNHPQITTPPYIVQSQVVPVSEVTIIAATQGPPGIQGAQGTMANWVKVTEDYIAVSTEYIIVDTQLSPVTVTLPENPQIGDYVRVVDGYDWAINNVTVDAQTQTIEHTQHSILLNIKNIIVDFVFNGTTWKTYASIGQQGIQGTTGIQGPHGQMGVWKHTTTNYSAVTTDFIIVDTTVREITITLPGNPVFGDYIRLVDGFDWNFHNVIVDRNASTIENETADLIIDIAGLVVDFVYSNNTWKVYTNLGKTGPIGLQGIQGIQGPQGIQGDLGPIGLQGVPGPIGLQGDLGPQGIQGQHGPQGTQGNLGVQGIQGPYGPCGLQGTQGNDGPRGCRGEEGIQGPNGPQGIQGIQGHGIQGSRGSQGIQGQQGLQGIQGNVGVQGLQGQQGVIGIIGSQGVQGRQGIQGLQGNLGVQGVQGNVGQIGQTGARGLQGLQGLQGVQGTLGLQGLQGYRGPVGIQGDKGLQGLQGLQGIQGPLGQWFVVTSEYYSNSKEYIVADTSSSPFIIHLPSNPQNGDFIRIADGDNWYLHNLGVHRNGSTIENIENNIVLSEQNIIVDFVYAENTWKVYKNKGLQGSQGIQGRQGLQGLQGTTGHMAHWVTVYDEYYSNSNESIIANTALQEYTIYLPEHPIDADYVKITDGYNWSNAPVTVNGNGHEIIGSHTNLILNISGITVDFIFSNNQWHVYTNLGREGSQGLQGPAGFARLDVLPGAVIFGKNNTAGYSPDLMWVGDQLGVGTMLPSASLHIKSNSPHLKLENNGYIAEISVSETGTLNIGNQTVVAIQSPVELHNSLTIGNSITTSATAVTSTTVPVVLLEFPISTVISCDVYVVAQRQTQRHAIKSLILHNNTVVSNNNYSSVISNSPLFSIVPEIVNNTLRIKVESNSNNSTAYMCHATLITAY